MSMQTLNVMLVDDEPLAIEGLRLRLEKIEGINIVGEATTGSAAIKACQDLMPDLMFIDLRLPDFNGLEVVQALQADAMPLIVFVSAYSEYALDAFELNAVDYILKPANIGRLQQSVDRAREKLLSNYEHQQKAKLLHALGDTLGVEVAELEQWLEKGTPLPGNATKELVIKNSDNEKVFVSETAINWIDAAGDYMCIHTDEENYIVRITMKKLEEQLDAKLFQRIHKSTLVNIQRIKSIHSLKNNESMLDLGKDIKLKVSRNYNSVIREIIASRTQ